jgi:hypothetical protein
MYGLLSIHLCTFWMRLECALQQPIGCVEVVDEANKQCIMQQHLCPAKENNIWQVHCLDDAWHVAAINQQDRVGEYASGSGSGGRHVGVKSPQLLAVLVKLYHSWWCYYLRHCMPVWTTAK